VIERVFEPGHPSTLGHFPGNPIVPGALLLSAVLDGIQAWLGTGFAPFQIRSAKFQRPARPGERVVISYDRVAGRETPGEEIRFTCTVGESPVLTGQISCIAPPKAK